MRKHISINNSTGILQIFCGMEWRKTLDTSGPFY